jgi:hypothetical protein
MARPTPLLPPVMMAERPVSEMSMMPSRNARPVGDAADV